LPKVRSPSPRRLERPDARAPRQPPAVGGGCCRGARGDPARRIAAIADQRRADLIVVGTRSHDAAPDAVLGSVSRRLAAEAPCPVLVIPPNLATAVRPERWPGRTLVCGLDGSEPGWSAAGHAAALAARLGGSLMTVSVGSGADAGASDEEVADRLQAHGRRAAPGIRGTLRRGACGARPRPGGL
jgi:hypothetical protein